MPVLYFDVTWPSGQRERCYSPSRVIEEHLTVGALYPVDDFLARVRIALGIASERVRAKYGFSCSAAHDQLQQIERVACSLTSAERAGAVRVDAFACSPTG